MNIQEYKYIKTLTKRKREFLSEHLPFEATSIGDLAFLLLIFFIVTGSFMLRQGIFFSLPSNTSGAVYVEPSNIINVQPATEGFIVDGVFVSREKLKEFFLQK